MTNIQLSEDSFTDDHRWNLIKRKANEQKAARAVIFFRRQNIEPILIKGIAVARYYPEDELRESVDVDLAVSSTDFPIANRLNHSADADGLAIDLHDELRDLDSVEWDDLYDNSELLEVEGTDIRVLRPEDHLRVICMHWLTDGGSNKDRLRDIYFMVENRRTDFDWSRCLDVVDPRQRRYFICALGAAERFLGLDLSDTPAAGAGAAMPTWMVRTIEKEWSGPQTRPLFTETDSLARFFEQLRKRLPPNPITATILRGGDIDAKTRVFYQLGTIADRIGPSIKSVANSVFRSRK